MAKELSLEQQRAFIEKIAPIVKKIAPEYGIFCPAAIIAQACIESYYGTSELAVNACNFHGLKYRQGRCPTATGIYHKVGSEQNADGSYTSAPMEWMQFPDMESGIRGYFDFTNISNYANLKGVADPRQYLTNIKADGYASSLDYVENNMRVIAVHNLTQYNDADTAPAAPVQNKLIFNVHAGHNPDGKAACGAVGLIKESTEARKVKERVIELLRAGGHTVFDCTEDNGANQSDILNKIVARCNVHPVNLDISIHFNAGAKKTPDNMTTGVEVYVYPNSQATVAAGKVAESIAALGFKNRGVKTSSSLYVLRSTKSPAMLIECCFVDDPEDVALYECDAMAEAIVKGLVGEITTVTSEPPKSGDSDVTEAPANNDIPSANDNISSTNDNIPSTNDTEAPVTIPEEPKKTVHYIVQVGEYQFYDNAQKKLDEMRGRGIPAIIREIEV